VRDSRVCTVYEDLLPSQRSLTPPSSGTPCDINASLKSTLVGYNSVADNTGLSSFV